MDEDLAAIPVDGYRFEHAEGIALVPGRVVLELKCRSAMPAVFRELVETFALIPQRSSKYRLAAEALGLVGIHA
jgi:hypothetical protein